MTVRSLTRASFLATLAGMVALAAAPEAQAARNGEAEGYVQENASAALRTLGDRTLSATQREQTFSRLMAQFSDMPRIAVWVLGRYGAQLRADAALRAEWERTFQDYAIATYEDRLERFSGSAIRVVSSTELVPGRTVDVVSQVVPRGQTRPMVVNWRLNRTGEVWRVFDVQVEFDNGDAIWLGQRQQADFLAALGGNDGDIRALITDVRRLTASMRQRIMARN